MNYKAIAAAILAFAMALSCGDFKAKKWGNEAKDDEIKTRAISIMSALIEITLRLKKLPAVNPAKVGHWIEYKYAEESEGHLISNFVCDKCHAWAGADYDYCPFCGAKMEGTDDRSRKEHSETDRKVFRKTFTIHYF